MGEERKRGNCCRFQSLAQETLTDILARLPYDSIVMCKCVCKAWNSVTSDSYFVKLQLAKSSRSSSNIIFEEHKVESKVTQKLYLLNVDGSKVREIPVFPLVEGNTCPVKRMAIFCSLDGLICFSRIRYVLDRVMIYNPLISGDCVLLPDSETYPCGKQRPINVTLGFDASINMYKVVRIWEGPRYYSDIWFEIFTIGKDSSWRQVFFPYKGREGFHRRGIYHQGSIYWMIGHNNAVIIEFDLTSEVFTEVSVPSSIRKPKYTYSVKQYSPLQSLGEYINLTEIAGRVLHTWKLVKQNGTRVVAYRSVRTESLYKYAKFVDVAYLNDNADLLLLQSLGGFEPGSTESGNRIKIQGTKFFINRRGSEKKNRLEYLPYLQNLFSGTYDVQAWCFKPSFVSIKQAMLNQL